MRGRFVPARKGEDVSVDGGSFDAEAGKLVLTDNSDETPDIEIDIPEFVGASETQAGAEGLVPAPQAGEEGRYLAGDGTWKPINIDGGRP